MILVFGGTTEGRQAAQTLEEAGKHFYYSTKTGEQMLTLHHGVRVDGAMDTAAMQLFCREHAIRLLMDAAHPFATRLHTTVAAVAAAVGVPVIRYERTFPQRDDSVEWVDGIGDIRWTEAPQRVLSALGVQSIARLKSLETAERHFLYRILPRESSLQLAHEQGATDEQLCFYREDEDEEAELRRLRPDVLLLKESGLSGGFAEKVAAARKLGIRVVALRRPDYLSTIRLAVGDAWITEHCQLVNGPRSLRRAVERMLPEFFPLRSGLTTGTCATAAVKAALLGWRGEETERVWVTLPDGESVSVEIEAMGPGWATVIKDFSDDPDVTRGCRIKAEVSSPLPISPVGEGATAEEGRIRFLQGEGVGRVTLPGLGIAVGEPAINPVPRRMIEAEVRALTAAAVDIRISVEHGRELAERTFNPRVGVVDGISIIGTTGMVTPLSNEAFVESIGRELEVARAIGCTAIGLASGKQGEEALLAAEPSLRVIHYGNFIGAALARAHALGFRRAVVGIMIGKAVKLAEGHLDTHSHKVLMNKTFLTSVAAEAGVMDAAASINNITIARELWDVMPTAFFEALRTRCESHCRRVFPTGELEIRLIQQP